MPVRHQRGWQMSDCGRFEVRFGGEVKPKAPLPHQLWWGISPTIAEVELCLEQLAATGFVLAMSVPVLAAYIEAPHEASREIIHETS